MKWGIRDITPMTLLDYPGKTACILWSGGCNMRCAYCYNPELLLPGENSGSYFPSVPRVKSLESFLSDRAGFLDGIVLSGGECTLNKNLMGMCSMGCEMGYSVKVDTNGTNPDVVKNLVKSGKVHYIALDYKAPPSLFTHITKCGVSAYDRFSQTLDYLIGMRFPFEVRTTIHPDLMNEQTVDQIISDLHSRGYQGIYYLQHYFHTRDNVGGLLNPVNPFDASRLSSVIRVVERNSPQG